MQMGRVAAANMLGCPQRLTSVPFFWTEHHGIKVRYVGHGSQDAQAQMYGDPKQGPMATAFIKNGRIEAVATVDRDDVSLACEAAMEEGGQNFTATAAALSSSLSRAFGPVVRGT